MTLERLIAEIRSRGERELGEETQKFEAEKARLQEDRAHRVTAIQEDFRTRTDAEGRRERTQRVAGARMQSRKLEYEAQERAMNASLEAVRGLLRDFTTSDEYPEVLRRMYSVATDELGKDVRVAGRAEDAALLKPLAGRSFDPTPVAILGGLIAETPDGDRRLSLSFDELLRLREDRVRSLLA
ncbi:MAG: V-type ATP synthase subunit E family protein [Thermoplasmata archaeon]